MVYLDYSATTPVNSEVLETFVEVNKNFIGNPNSLHKLGIKSKKLIDAATNQIASILKVKPSEIIYTSGASEANNTVIKGVCLKYQNRGKHIITTELEHSSVIGPISYLTSLGFEVDFVKLDENGVVDLENLKELLREDTILVSIASVNSEIGIKQPLDKISKIVKQTGKTFFHSDITQSVGKEKLDLSVVDFASLSAQKFFGLKGIGILIKKENIQIEPLIHGGKSTTIYRSGTPATPLIASTAKALRIIYDDFDRKYDKVVELNNYLLRKLKEMNISINSNKNCIPHIINISIDKIKPETMLHALAEDDIYISTMTACSTSKSSRAVYIVTNNSEKSKHSLRISLSYLTTKEELDLFLNSFSKNIEKLKEVSPK